MVKRLGNVTAAVALGLLLSGTAVNADELKTMTTTANLNIRSGAGNQYSVLGSYSKNTSVQVIAIENGWAKVLYNGKTAYCSASYLKVTNTTKTMKTKASLNVRTGPGTNYGVLGSLKKGETISVKSISNGWAKVSFKGKTGYCSKEYLEEVSSSSNSSSNSSSTSNDTSTTMISTASLNVRSGAGTKYSIIGSYAKGAKVSVSSIKDGWAKVSYKGKTGYCSTEYLKKTSDSSGSSNNSSSNSTGGSTNSSSGISNSTSTTMITTANLNVRSGAGTKYSVIGSYSKGAKVSVLSINKDWAKVSYNGKTGYCSAEYLKKATSEAEKEESYTMMEVTTYVNVRKGPGTTYEKLGMLNPKDKVKVLSIDKEWAKISYNNKTAYVSTAYLKEINSSDEEEITYKIMKSTTHLNVRRGASVTADRIGLLSPEEEVKVIAISKDWAKILYKNEIAYCSSEYLEEIQEPSTKPSKPETPEVPDTPSIEVVSDTISVSASQVNVRKGPGQEHEIIGSVSQGQILKRTGVHESGWVRIEYNGQQGYISGDYVIAVSYDSNNTIYHYNKEHSFTLKSFMETQLAKYNFASTGEAINSDTLNKYMNTDLIVNNGNIYQFLKLNRFRNNINVGKLNSYLSSLRYDTFYNQGQAFIDAAREYNIDPLYLVAHTILETGYGKSTLARGVDYEITVPTEDGQSTETKVVRVYNLFGIGAYDSDPLGGGAATAYANGWTSIEKAIKGGAQWIAKNYVHSTRAGQHQYTVYMMRWNTNNYISQSSNATWHQYATDISWADSISKLMKQLSYLYEGESLELEIPIFLQQ
ncbi:SH3 domain-containing protein [Alloiococcus sp. CFN-8]|uniref:SH3 domain-containing protein n=1 Tax=Alloiococcus sp. CFN-8 TaxID=3416081 RepID=UPI003CEB4634